MSPNSVLLMFLLLCLVEFSLTNDKSNFPKSKVLSRRKRYVAFPEGSSFSCASCITVGMIGQPAPTTGAGTFTYGLNWGIAYELPNATETSLYYRQKKQFKSVAQRRSRRELYDKLETIIDSMGYNGRQCILKTLCEVSQRLVPGGPNMIEEMFRILFTLPMAKVLKVEPMEHTIYDAAQRLGKMMQSCDIYECPLSLVDLVKGYYDAPASDFDPILNPWALLNSNMI